MKKVRGHDGVRSRNNIIKDLFFAGDQLLCLCTGEMKITIGIVAEVLQNIRAPSFCLVQIFFRKRYLIEPDVCLNQKSVVLEKSFGRRAFIFVRAEYLSLVDKILLQKKNP